MRTVTYVCSLMMLLSLGLGCGKDKNDCFKSTGEIVFEDRGVQSFTQIETHNNVNVIITQDTFTSVTIEAGKNLIGKVTTVVQGDSLVIRNNNKCNWIRSYKYDINAYITVKNLRRIDHQGFGKISSSTTVNATTLYISNHNNGDIELDLNVGYLYTDMHKTGDVILKGAAGGHEVYSSGNNWLRCSLLETGYTALHSVTTGDCYVRALDSLTAGIYSLGSIYYSGNPQKITSTIEGSGELIEN